MKTVQSEIRRLQSLPLPTPAQAFALVVTGGVQPHSTTPAAALENIKRLRAQRIQYLQNQHAPTDTLRYTERSSAPRTVHLHLPVTRGKLHPLDAARARAFIAAHKRGTRYIVTTPAATIKTDASGAELCIHALTR